MDNPCRHCNEANLDYVNECEYGCDNPCEQAKLFYKAIGERLDDLLRLAKRMIDGEQKEATP